MNSSTFFTLNSTDNRANIRISGAAALAVLQLFLNFIPSIILNSLIVASYRHCRHLRTPYNFLYVCFSGLSIFSNIILAILGTIVHPIALRRGVCLYTHIEVKSQHVLVFTLPPLTIALINIVQCYVILHGTSKLSFKKVVFLMVAVWSYGVLASLTGVVGYLYTVSQPCDTAGLTQSQLGGRIRNGFVFNSLDVLLIDIPCFFIIVITTITSCGCYFKKAQRSTVNMQRRMLLLPILMIGLFVLTSLLSRLLIPLIPILGHMVNFLLLPISATVIRLISQFNSFLFAALLIGLNKNFREGIKTMLKDTRMKICGERTPSGQDDIPTVPVVYSNSNLNS